MTDTTARTPLPRRRRWWRFVLLALGILLVLVTAFAWWLLGTASGLSFALTRAQGFTAGALQVGQAEGRLIGPLTLTNVRYDDGKGTRATVGSIRVDYAFRALLGRTVHVRRLDVEDVSVQLPAPQPDSEAPAPFSLEPPVVMQLDQAHVGKVTIIQEGKPLFASNTLDLAASWTKKGIEVHQLALRAPDGEADLTGTLAVGKGYRGDGQAQVSWQVGDTLYAGKVVAHSDGAKAKLSISVTDPTLAQVDMDLVQSGDYAWTAKIDAPRFDPKPLLGESSLTALGLHVQGSGDRYGANLTGDADVNEYHLRLTPLHAHFDKDYKTLTLEQLNLATDRFKGALQASGTVDLGASPVSANLTLAWTNLLLPADLAGQELASQGKVIARGSADAFHVEGAVDVGPPGKLAKLALNIDGTPQRIALNTLTMLQAKGKLDATGTLTLQPELAWKLDAKAEHFDPGQLVAGYDGSLDFDLGTEGVLAKAGPHGTLDLRKLIGTVRKREVGGSGELTLKPNRVVNGKLQLNSGNSTVGIDARGDAANDADVRLAIASLGDWVPDAGGKIDGRFNVKGLWPKLSVDGTLNGQAVVYAGEKIQRLMVEAHVPDVTTPGGELNVVANGVSASGLAFDSVRADAGGNAQRHELHVVAHGQPLSTEVALNGSLQGKHWSGSLATLDLDFAGMPRWRLAKPAALDWNDGAASLGEACLTAGDPSLCVAAKQDKPGNLDASYKLRQVPLALLMSLAGNANMPIRAEGMLEGDGAIRRSAAGALSGQADVRSAHGSVAYSDHPDQPLVTYDGLTASAQLSPATQHLLLAATLDKGGRLQGNVTVSGAQQALSGQVGVDLVDLGVIELFTSELADAKGRFHGNFQLGGTVAKPAVTGQANLEDFSGEVPTAGLKLSQGRLTLSTTDAQVFRIDGGVHSGKGQLTIAGSAGIGAGAGTTLAITGSQFTAMDIPAAQVVISPALTIKQSKEGINITGKVTLDLADVDVSRLPGAGATKASPDVVVVDEKNQQQEEEATPISADISVDLGQKTHLVGFGMDGKVSGVLAVRERPGRVTSGQGQIRVDGVYRAYGQNLNIERGQLLFASTPIDNPGLDIRASRRINPNSTVDDGQKVGLYVSGTARRPVLTVFSEPTMEQSDALSYLITGKPLSQVKGGEGNLVGGAAQALGSAAGDLLAKKIGSRIGVDDIGVQNSDALNGSSAFTVGKYLSPRLYLSYGVGLFEPGQVITLRYLFSRRWNFEAQNATEFSRASFNYRLEK